MTVISPLPDWRDYQDGQDVLEGLAAFSGVHVALRGAGSAELVAGEVVSGELFSLLGVEAVHGRLIVPGDEATVVVLGHGLWRRVFGGDPRAVGKTVRMNGEPFTVVGIAPEGFRGLDPERPADLPLADVTSYDDLLAATLARERTATILLGASGVLALVLTGFGLYAALSFAVARRTGEIGIRMALGAGPRQVSAWIVGSGLRLAGAGLAAGLPAGAWLGGRLSEVLLRVRPGEPAAYVEVAVLVLALAFAAAALPAAAAARVDPLASFRRGSES